jgi:hypothetical protein
VANFTLFGGTCSNTNVFSDLRYDLYIGLIEMVHTREARRAFAAVMLLASLLLGMTALNAQASRLRGVSLPPLDAGMVDESLESSNGASRASINFVNQSSSAVDIYWIDYDGHRVLYRANLAVGASWQVGTLLTHPWLVVVSGTGGTTAQDTGTRLAGFMALTAYGDTAIITDKDAK